MAECLPERLLLDGFRRWLAGYASGDLRHWEAVWNSHAAEIGTEAAGVVVDRLAEFAKSVRAWSICPVDCIPRGCRHACRHECFALAMVAATQHDDMRCLEAAMRYLIAEDGHSEVILPTLAYAQALKENGLELQPVPLSVIEAIAGRPQGEQLH